MAITLAKGQKIDLTKSNPGLKKVRIGLGWDTNKYTGGQDFDLDVSVFALGADEKVTSESDLIFYNQPKHPSGGIIHTGDNRTGDGQGDDESVLVELQKLPEAIRSIAFTVTIHEAAARSQNFGMVSNAYVRVINEETNEELMRYDLQDDFSLETALVVAKIYRKDSEWKFGAEGQGFVEGLGKLCSHFGINL